MCSCREVRLLAFQGRSSALFYHWFHFCFGNGALTMTTVEVLIYLSITVNSQTKQNKIAWQFFPPDDFTPIESVSVFLERQ